RDRHGAGAAVLAVGGPGVAQALRAVGLVAVAPAEMASAKVVAVVQGYGPGVAAADLAEVAYAVEGGARWVATNVDLTLPTDRGVAPGNGSLVRAVATAVGHEPDEIVGKPFAALYVLCAERLGTEPARLLAVGDRLDTDIAGAVRAGLDALLVLTGVDDVAAVVAAPPAMRPTFLAEDLRVLHTPLPVPRADGGLWRCGDDAGRLVDGRWAATATGTREQSLTNRLHAVYEALDEGRLDPADAAALVADGRG
ncbi:HAD-IIA family hydrolase, partial [Nostocoides japonicum]|uniref:HAD-IIA family hydrolase n=1 Tax=Nostocoides japonicum TaxID=99481 RepID=UPI0012FBCA44